MVNVNKTKESIQNVLIFITDAIALIMSYYMSGFIWLMEIRNNTFSYVMKVLNGNIVTIIIAVLIAALFCNIKGDVLNRGKFEELASVMKKSLISSAVIAGCSKKCVCNYIFYGNSAYVFIKDACQGIYEAS